MIRIFTIILLTGSILSAPSCKKALETKGHSFLSPTTFYKNEADANAALNGAFSLLFSQDMYARSVWLVSDLPGDIFYNVINNADRTALFLGTFTATNGTLAIWWGANYSTIKNANDVIENVPAIKMDEIRKNNIIGNARFLRALCYYNLVTGYGDVPLVLTTGIDTLFPARAPASQVYAQIIEDLKYAETHCLHTADLPDEEIGRVTSEAASTLLTKTYLQKASTTAAESTDYQNALTHCNTVISYSQSHSSVLSLDPVYGNVFNPDTKNGQECIFNIQFGNPPNASNIINLAFDPIALGGFGSYNALDVYYDSFKPEDVIRRTVNVGYTENSAHKISKFHDEGVSPGTFGRINWIILRYADVLLMHSEILHQINPADANKFNSINLVRERAEVSPLDFTTTPSDSDFITALVNERAWEFCVEGHRRWDLIRLKRFEEVQESIGHTFDPNRLLFPIPQTEMDVNPNLVQNPGY